MDRSTQGGKRPATLQQLANDGDKIIVPWCERCFTDDRCEMKNEGRNLVECSACMREYHLSCLNGKWVKSTLTGKDLPLDKWLCENCGKEALGPKSAKKKKKKKRKK